MGEQMDPTCDQPGPPQFGDTYRNDGGGGGGAMTPRPMDMPNMPAVSDTTKPVPESPAVSYPTDPGRHNHLKPTNYAVMPIDQIPDGGGQPGYYGGSDRAPENQRSGLSGARASRGVRP